MPPGMLLTCLHRLSVGASLCQQRTPQVLVCGPLLLRLPRSHGGRAYAAHQASVRLAAVHTRAVQVSGSKGLRLPTCIPAIL